MTRFLVAATVAAAAACAIAAPAGAAGTLPECFWIGWTNDVGVTVCTPSAGWGDRVA